MTRRQTSTPQVESHRDSRNKPEDADPSQENPEVLPQDRSRPQDPGLDPALLPIGDPAAMA